MDIERIFAKPKLWQALTSLAAGEFAWLLELFETQHTVTRQRDLGRAKAPTNRWNDAALTG